ncbi:hypothetical protein I4F81_000085 [Pyropia yezoensis]|uniref:Uncharacterized protein n=1 Tax=Pyropia yezoensis TaxID=2788 RepID=A0ACC3BHY6_PYRYE|nr:hypothetical protein I4F81_000085 [Neopyropia yezoensis]
MPPPAPPAATSLPPHGSSGGGGGVSGGGGGNRGSGGGGGDPRPPPARRRRRRLTSPPPSPRLACGPPASEARNLTAVDRGSALALLRRVNLLRESNALALDIGGTLAKLIGNYHTDDGAAANDDGGSSGSDGSAVRLIRATGGGAYKYADLFETVVGVQLVRLDEMACTVAGLNLMLTRFEAEVYEFHSVDAERPPSPTPSPVRGASGGSPAVSNGVRVGGDGRDYGSTGSTGHAGRDSPSCGGARNGPSAGGSGSRPPAPPGGAAEPPPPRRVFVPATADPFPYLLVNIGSGVSIVHVTGHGQFTRVSGSSLGGGTFWGLSRLLTNCKTFDEVIELTKAGDNAAVDMLVGDIYGAEGYGALGLSPDVIAASFGKVTMRRDEDGRGGGGHRGVYAAALDLYRAVARAVIGTLYLWAGVLAALPGVGRAARAAGLDALLAAEPLANTRLARHFHAPDVALSLLRMVSYNIGQVAVLNARLLGLHHVYFGGNFVRDVPYTMHAISYAVGFWSDGDTVARFLKHDGFLGAVGAFLNADSTPPPGGAGAGGGGAGGWGGDGVGGGQPPPPDAAVGMPPLGV